MQNVVLSGDMVYVETDKEGVRYLIAVIPFPEKASGWVPDNSQSVERVTAIHAANGELGFRDMLTQGTVNEIKGLDDPTAKVIVKLTCDPFVARDTLGQTIVVGESRTAKAKPERRGIPLDDLTAKAADKSRAAGPVTSRKMTPLEKANKK